MRLALPASLIALSLLVTGLWAAASAPKPVPRPRGVVVSTGGTAKNPSWTVTGWGETPEGATKDALTNARKELTKYLAERRPPVRWQPSPEYIDRNLVKERSADPKDLPELKDVPGLGKMYQATLKVELDAKHCHEILEYDRQERMQARQLLLGKVLAGVLAVLAAVVGYCRLEERTKGYYTLWLRLAAVALVGVVGAALLVIA